LPLPKTDPISPSDDQFLSLFGFSALLNFQVAFLA